MDDAGGIAPRQCASQKSPSLLKTGRWEHGTERRRLAGKRQRPAHPGETTTGSAGGRTTPAAPFRHGRRPQPHRLSSRFRFCPAAISSASPLTFGNPPRPEPPEPVPVLGVGEERLHPHLAFAHGLGEGFRRVVAAHTVEVGLVEVAPHPSPTPRRGARRLERTRGARRGRRLVDPPTCPIVLGDEVPHLVPWAAIGVILVVTGLTTDVCVGSTARDAFQRDFHHRPYRQRGDSRGPERAPSPAGWPYQGFHLYPNSGRGGALSACTRHHGRIDAGAGRKRPRILRDNPYYPITGHRLSKQRVTICLRAMPRTGYIASDARRAARRRDGSHVDGVTDGSARMGATEAIVLILIVIAVIFLVMQVARRRRT